MEDKYLWLEEVEGESALNWVKTKNSESDAFFNNNPNFKTFEENAFNVFSHKEKLSYPVIINNEIHNLWTDEKNIKGIWRKSDWKSYLQGSPNWETILDVDKLSETENESWVLAGLWRSLTFSPSKKRAMVRLSPGGSDAAIWREFDLTTKKFVEDGFVLPLNKSVLSWKSDDCLIVGTKWSEDEVTSSGYPMILKEWHRGTPLTSSTEVCRGEKDHVSIWVYPYEQGDQRTLVYLKSTTFWTNEFYFIKDDKEYKVPIPEDANISNIFQDQVIISLNSNFSFEGTEYKSGSLISFHINDVWNGKIKEVHLLFQPEEHMNTAEYISKTKNSVYLKYSENIQDKIFQFKWNGQWEKKNLDVPEVSSIGFYEANHEGNQYFYTVENSLIPKSLFCFNEDTNETILVKKEMELFNSENLEIKQYWATSKDGEKIPYFQIANKALMANGSNPTVVYGYGGFRNSLMPYYNANRGKNWLEEGGVYIIANIRGGSEFGPRWHQSALKENRQRCFDDFIAVSEHLIERNITSSKNLGIWGGSNGGLLVGACLTQRPDLFNAVVCSVPLLDMLRYHKLLAGASWIDEYGNPDIPEEREYIAKYSPYQNVKEDIDYPEVFFNTSTKDDRVHPGHARKMVALLSEYNNDVLYYENIEGGHGGAANLKQSASLTAKCYSYLWKKLN